MLRPCASINVPRNPSFAAFPKQSLIATTPFRARKTREHELFETLRVAQHGDARTTVRDTSGSDGVNEVAFGQEKRVERRRGSAASAAVGFDGDEERLLRAVDNGDPDL